MTSDPVFNVIVYVWFVIAALTFIALQFLTAPYGRHTRGGWGPMINPKLGWMIMESPVVILMFWYYFNGVQPTTLVGTVFLVMWQFHYIHRTYIFPLRMRSTDKRMPVSIVGSAVFFNIMNGYLQGHYLYDLASPYPNSWLMSPMFIVGAILFVVGFAINYQSDGILRNLRKPGESGYKIPNGGCYRWISNPNYFGELIEWTGWAIATWSISGVLFVVWTAANLVPRAISNHAWYKEKFAEYPKARKAIVPFIW